MVREFSQTKRRIAPSRPPTAADPNNRLDTKSSLALQLRHNSVAQGTSRAVRWRISRETRVVTKKEIVKAISEEIGLTQLKTKEIVQKTFDAIVDTLVTDRRIELRNFGVFEVKKRAARKARNPRTGERVAVPEKFVVTFKPGKEMEERVRKLEEEAARAAAQAPTGHSPTAVNSPQATGQPPSLGAGHGAPAASQRPGAYNPSFAPGTKE